MNKYLDIAPEVAAALAEANNDHDNDTKLKKPTKTTHKK